MSLFSNESTPAMAECSSILIVAVGGCGISVVSQLYQKGLENADILSIDTDAQRLAEMPDGQRVLLGESITEGFGTGGDDLLAARCLSGSHMSLRDKLSKSKATIIVGGLGGGTATAVMPEVAKISRSLGILTLIVATKPFRYEGSQKLAKAKRRIHSLFRTADSVFLINNESIAGEKKNLSASEAISRSDAALIESVDGLLEFLTPEKRMMLDFGTVKNQLSHGGLAAIANGVSAMRNNAIEAFKKAIDTFAHHKSDITKAPRALIQFSIDDDVLMDGVKNAFGVAQRVFSKDAQLSLGVVFNGKKQGKTKVSVIATGLPLFNEIVDVNRKPLPEVEQERPSRGVSRRARELQFIKGTGQEGSALVTDKDGSTSVRKEYTRYHILNSMRTQEEDMRIPAYLRRRQLNGGDQ